MNLNFTKMSKSNLFVDRIKEMFGETNIVLVDTEYSKKLEDKQELIKFLLDIRAIRVEWKERYSRQINAVNPLSKGYNETIKEYRAGYLRMTLKIKLIDDIIEYINQK